MAKTIKGVIFDLDGTLLDSIEDIADMANAILESHGYDTHSYEEFKKFVGYGSRELFVRSSLAKADDATIDAMRDEYERVYQENPSRKSKIYSGVKELLACLFDSGYKVAILSNKPNELTKKCVQDFLGEFSFDAVYGEIRGIERKPDPAGALTIAAELSLHPSEFAFVGDTKTDMQTAKNAGMFAVGVTWGFRDKQELVQNGANEIINTPQGLLNVLDKRQ